MNNSLIRNCIQHWLHVSNLNDVYLFFFITSNQLWVRVIKRLHLLKDSDDHANVANLDWLFMLVLPVARLSEPCSRHVVISFWVVTCTSVDPDRVMTPFDPSRICTGGFPGTDNFPVCPLPFSTLPAATVAGSSKSRTSSFRICPKEAFSSIDQLKFCRGLSAQTSNCIRSGWSIASHVLPRWTKRVAGSLLDFSASQSCRTMPPWLAGWSRRASPPCTPSPWCTSSPSQSVEKKKEKKWK